MMMMTKLVKLLLFFIVLPPLSVAVHTGPEQKALEEGLSQLQHWDGTPEAQIKKWWYDKQAKDRNFPRVFPWCFSTGPGYKLPAEVAQFKKAFDHATVKNLKAFDPDIFSWEAYDSTRTGLVKNIKPYRIQIKRYSPDTSIFGGVEGASWFQLEQWAAFRVQLNTVEHLYVQSIGGPLGVPVGEFNVDFKCKEDPNGGDYFKVAKVVPCHFAPKSAYMWPNVFVAHSTGTGLNEITFQFRWTETHCHETGFFQFLMIVTSKSGQTDFILSPIYQFTDLYSPCAVPSPYHPYLDEVQCDYAVQPNNIQEYKDKRFSRIIANKEYDDCVVNGKAEKTDLNRDKCPPGPFECSPIKWNNVNEWKNLVIYEWFPKLVKNPIEQCCEIKFPLAKPTGPSPPTTTTASTTTSTTGPTTTTTTTTAASTTATSSTSTTHKPVPPPTPAPTSTDSPQRMKQKEQEKFLRERTLKFEIKHQITHGDFCVLVWLIFVPLADNIVRYFKDFSEIPGLGLGFWIIAHVSLHCVGLMSVWWSYGLVIGGGQERLGNIVVQHYIAGIVASLLQHIQFITGLKRTEKDRKSFNWVLTHSLCGYLSHLAGYVSVILSTAGQVRKWISLGLFGIWIAATVAFFLAEKRQEKLLDIVFHRAQCPVLQRIVIDKGPPPMGKVKIGILTFMVFCQGGLYAYMLIAHSAEKTALGKIQATTTTTVVVSNSTA